MGSALIEVPTGSHIFSSHGNEYIGFLAIFGACFTSGFGGVYLEKLLKSGSLWAINLQLSFIGIIIGFMGVYGQSIKEVNANGFFQGYTRTVWAIIVIQAAGGLIIGVVLKYSDNIMKIFSSVMGMVGAVLITQVSGLAVVVSARSVVGLFFVGLAIHLYCFSEPENPDRVEPYSEKP